MIRSRIALLLAFVALLATAGTALAQSTEPVLPAEAAEPAAVAAAGEPTPAIAAQVCTEAQPAATPLAAAIPPEDFILCSCRLCRARPDEVCRVSPTGFSILCEHYWAVFC